MPSEYVEIEIREGVKNHQAALEKAQKMMDSIDKKMKRLKISKASMARKADITPEVMSKMMSNIYSIRLVDYLAVAEALTNLNNPNRSDGNA